VVLIANSMLLQTTTQLNDAVMLLSFAHYGWLPVISSLDINPGSGFAPDFRILHNR